MIFGVSGELNRAADGQVVAPQLLLHFNHSAARAQSGIIGDFLHREHRSAWHPGLAQHLHRLKLGLVGKPLLDLGKNIEDMGLARAGSAVSGIVDPFRMADRRGGRPPVLLLDGEIDVSVWVGLPSLALEDPTGLAAASCVATARDCVTELAVRILRIFFQVADMIEMFLRGLTRQRFKTASCIDTETFWPLPVLSRPTSAVRMPIARCIPVLLSPRAAPLMVGGPSQKPVVEAAPPAHCATFSYTLMSA